LCVRMENEYPTTLMEMTFVVNDECRWCNIDSAVDGTSSATVECEGSPPSLRHLHPTILHAPFTAKTPTKDHIDQRTNQPTE
jgi:hypothetical protein